MQNPNETPEQKLTRLQTEEIEKKRADGACATKILWFILIAPFVFFGIVAILGAIIQALK